MLARACITWGESFIPYALFIQSYQIVSFISYRQERRADTRTRDAKPRAVPRITNAFVKICF